MAQSMRDIKRKINSFENTTKITKAMKMVAASKLRKAQEKTEFTQNFVAKMKGVIARLTYDCRFLKHPMMTSTEGNKVAYIVITSDRGLCGGFNANLLRFIFKEPESANAEFFIVGNKGFEYLKRRNHTILESVLKLPDVPSAFDVAYLSDEVIKGFIDKKFDKVYLFYNQFVNAIVQRPIKKCLLPIEDDEFKQDKPSENLYEYEPSEMDVLSKLLPGYIETVIYSAVVDSKASEFASKMTAMSNATDNATKMIGDLRIQYNRARQAAITQEIAEIVGGAAALEA